MYKIIVATQYITVISVYLSSFMYKTILNRLLLQTLQALFITLYDLST